MERRSIVVETAGGHGPGDEAVVARPWYEAFSVRRRGPGLNTSPLLRLANRFLSAFSDLVLVPRYARFEAIATHETDPTTEYHHHMYCHGWYVGREHFDYLLRRGLKPADRVLDFGCGAMRTGVWLVRYLDAGNYHGLDAHRPSLDAAAGYEIPLHGLEDKSPRLLHSTDAQVEHFGVKFDTILLFAVLIHLTPEAQIQILRRIAAVLAPHGRIIVFRMPKNLSAETLRHPCNLTITHQEITRSRFKDGEMDWAELQRI